MPRKNNKTSKFTTLKVPVEVAKVLRHKHIDTGEDVQDLAERAIRFFANCEFPAELTQEGYEKLKRWLQNAPQENA